MTFSNNSKGDFMGFFKKNLKPIVSFAVMGVLLVLATFFDLQFSRFAVDLEPGKYYSTNFFGVFFEIFGERPVYYVTSIGLFFIFFYLKKVSTFKKGTKITLMALCAVIALGLNYYGATKLIKYLLTHGWISDLEGIMRTVATVSVAIVFTALWLFVCSRINKKYLKGLAVCGLIIIFTAAFSQAATHLLKPFFGRARYRMLNVMGDFSQYTRWYVVNGKRSVPEELLALGVAKDGYKSFPSGHTSSAGVILAIMSLPVAFKNMPKKVSWILTIVAYAYTLTVAFSRVVIGAHYASDVIIGALLSLVGFYLGVFVIKKILARFTKTADE